MQEFLATRDTILIFIPLLFMVSAIGLTYSFILGIRAGVDNYSEVYTKTAERGFADIFYFIPRRRISELAWITAGSLFAAFFLLSGGFTSFAGMLRGAVVGFIVAIMALSAPKIILKILKKRRLIMFNEQLVDALMTMSNALKSGSSIMQAFEHIVRENLNPISLEFGMFLQQTRVGVKFEEALANLEHRVGSEDLTLVVSSIEIARQTGGNLTEVFEQIAGTIRERMRIQTRVQTLTSQGRLQGIVVGLMPVGLGFAMFFLDPRLMLSFLHSHVGLLIIGVVIILEIIGALMIRKIIDIDI
ncbi:MAG: secretion system protein [Lentisphaerae bacterium]|nr:secretion system protein [Lentisphaerota bacterium]